MADYYKHDLGGTVRYYLVAGENTAVTVVRSSNGSISNAGTHDDIMSDVQEATQISEQEVPDDVKEELERGRDNLL